MGIGEENQQQPEEGVASPSAPRKGRGYRYFLGNSGFSIFDTMAKLLDQRGGDWVRETNSAATSKCALVLGDRFDIPYETLRVQAQLCDGKRPLVNYFKGSHRLTLKASMAKLLRSVVPHIHDYMPISFVLGNVATAATASAPTSNEAKPKPKSRFARQAPPKSEDERDAFLAAAAAESAAGRPRQWIVKPSAGCKGEGITIWPTAEAAVAHVDQVNASGTSGLFAVQSYIPNPLLLDGGRKFDIRVWAMVTPPFAIHIFNQGSCRTASVAYDATDLSNPLMHLTNHGLQQGSDTFGQYEDGNELWYSALDAALQARFGGAEASFERVVAPQIKRIVVDTLYAVKELIEMGNHERFECFQLFGFDLMLDDALHLHLIEINGSPGAADRWLVPLVHAMIETAVDTRFTPTAAGEAGRIATQAVVDSMAQQDGETGRWILSWDPKLDPAPYQPTSSGAADVAVVVLGA